MARVKETEDAFNKALERCGEVGFEGLTEPEKVLVSIWGTEGDVNNGGFDQFFYNSSGDCASFVPIAFRKIRANKMAKLVEKASSIFGSEGPPKEISERRNVLKSFGDKYVEFLTAIDRDFQDYPDDVYALVGQYVKKNF